MPDGTCALGGIEVSFRISLNTPNGTCAPEGIKASFRVSLNTLNGTCALGGIEVSFRICLKVHIFFSGYLQYTAGHVLRCIFLRGRMPRPERRKRRGSNTRMGLSLKKIIFFLTFSIYTN